MESAHVAAAVAVAEAVSENHFGLVILISSADMR